MMETQFPPFDHSSEIGKVEIAPEVIEVISGLAASEVDGVAYMRGGFVGGLTERFGRKNLSKGIKVELGEEHIVVDVSIAVEFGVRIPEVAEAVQENVKNTIENMTGLHVLEVNVHVVHVQVKNESTLSEDKRGK